MDKGLLYYAELMRGRKPATRKQQPTVYVYVPVPRTDFANSSTAQAQYRVQPNHLHQAI